VPFPGETLEFAQIAKDSLAAPALYRRIVGDVVRIDNRRGATGWASEFHGEPQLPFRESFEADESARVNPRDALDPSRS
jgi:hypothetical protein